MENLFSTRINFCVSTYAIVNLFESTSMVLATLGEESRPLSTQNFPMYSTTILCACLPPSFNTYSHLPKLHVCHSFIVQNGTYDYHEYNNQCNGTIVFMMARVMLPKLSFKSHEYCMTFCMIMITFKYNQLLCINVLEYAKYLAHNLRR